MTENLTPLEIFEATSLRVDSQQFDLSPITGSEVPLEVLGRCLATEDFFERKSRRIQIHPVNRFDTPNDSRITDTYSIFPARITDWGVSGPEVHETGNILRLKELTRLFVHTLDPFLHEMALLCKPGEVGETILTEHLDHILDPNYTPPLETPGTIETRPQVIDNGSVIWITRRFNQIGHQTVFQRLLEHSLYKVPNESGYTIADELARGGQLSERTQNMKKLIGVFAQMQYFESCDESSRRSTNKVSKELKAEIADVNAVSDTNGSQNLVEGKDLYSLSLSDFSKKLAAKLQENNTGFFNTYLASLPMQAAFGPDMAKRYSSRIMHPQMKRIIDVTAMDFDTPSKTVAEFAQRMVLQAKNKRYTGGLRDAEALGICPGIPLAHNMLAIIESYIGNMDPKQIEALVPPFKKTKGQL